MWNSLHRLILFEHGHWCHELVVQAMGSGVVQWHTADWWVQSLAYFWTAVVHK